MFGSRERGKITSEYSYLSPNSDFRVIQGESSEGLLWQDNYEVLRTKYFLSLYTLSPILQWNCKK